jgi:hypothetical protein
LYENIHFSSASKARKLVDLTRGKVGIPLAERIRQDTRAISIGYRFSAVPELEKGLMISDVSYLLQLARGLTSFVCNAAHLSVLPQAVLQTLFENHVNSLMVLHGFATGFSFGADVLPFFGALDNIECLTTGPTSLPSHAPSCSAIVEGLLSKSEKRLFPKLRSLYTPMVENHNVLFDLLVQCELPSLRHLRVSSWDRNSLRLFLTQHGSKLNHLELKYSWTEETLANKFIHARPPKNEPPVLLSLISLCPNLEELTLHDGYSFGLVGQAGPAWAHPRLRTIRMGCSSLEGCEQGLRHCGL